MYNSDFRKIALMHILLLMNTYNLKVFSTETQIERLINEENHYAK
jgi:hypothetical protein